MHRYFFKRPPHAGCNTLRPRAGDAATIGNDRRARSGRARMRAVPVVLVAAACAHAPVVPPRPAADFLRETHAMLDAFDRGDAARVAAITAPNFVRFEAGKVHERAAELARLRPQPPQITRAWKDEHVYIGVNDATFIGLAAEHEIGN